MLSKRSVADNHQLCFAMSAAHFLEGFDQRRQAISRIEASQEKESPGRLSEFPVVVVRVD
jgi:hypothetical protein